MSNLSLKRNIKDYQKVQALISSVIRGNPLFIKKNRLNQLAYLDIGCGVNSSKDFVNLDYSWLPQIDVCWDLTKKSLPFEDNRFKGVYSEHCFEHLPLQHFKKNMAEVYRVLKSNGTFRLIMPDGEIYLDIYSNRKNGSNEKMPYEENYMSGMHRINGIFRNHGHQFIYDFETVNKVLAETGFKQIVKLKYRTGRDPVLLRDTQAREAESLYVEAVK